MEQFLSFFYQNISSPLVRVLDFYPIFVPTKKQKRFIMTNTIKLQGLKEMPAQPAKNIKVGDFLIWNFGHEVEVIELIKETAKTIVIKTKDVLTGNIHERRLFKIRLVAIKEVEEIKSKEDKEHELTSDILSNNILECIHHAYHYGKGTKEDKISLLSYFIVCSKSTLKRIEKTEGDYYYGRNKSSACEENQLSIEASEYLIPLMQDDDIQIPTCLLYTSPSPRDRTRSRMPSSA